MLTTFDSTLRRYASLTIHRHKKNNAVQMVRCTHRITKANPGPAIRVLIGRMLVGVASYSNRTSCFTGPIVLTRIIQLALGLGASLKRSLTHSIRSVGTIKVY